MSPTVSWVILTYNRCHIVDEAITHCMNHAGDSWDELVWVDNGSNFQDFDYLDNVVIDADISIRNKENKGVAKGYNQAIGLATKDYIVITGCDMMMPKNWLKTFKDYVTKIPETGVACMYSSHWTTKPERIRLFGIDDTHALPIVHAMPIERRIFKRELLADIGYFPESFGLYGFDDLAWAKRAEKVCASKGLLTYVIPDMVAEHLGTEGIEAADGKDDPEYHNFKRQEAADPAKRVELQRLKDLGWPRFSPFL